MSLLSGAQQESLDLIDMGPTSFAALYRFLVAGGAQANVGRIWAEILELERMGMVDIWMMDEGGRLSSASEEDRAGAVASYDQWLTRFGAELRGEEVAVDPVGCWLSRRRGGASVAVGSNEKAWTLDQASDGHVTVFATDYETARSALAEWSLRNHDRANWDELEACRVDGFDLRSGQRIVGGVRITARRPTTNDPDPDPDVDKR